jgi:hypothetical protein
MATPEEVQAFVQRWQGVTASELATAQSFVMALCSLLEVPAPHPTPEQEYMFERPVTFTHGDGSTSAGRIDCYRRGHFVLEAKKLKAGSHTKGFDDGLLRARTQAEGYARALPAGEGRPPFLLVIDVGTVIEVYAEFSLTGGTYTPFPDPRSHRIVLSDLSRPEVLERLRLIWIDPETLNPARISAKVTRDVSQLLAKLARSLEDVGHSSHDVAAYLSRCLFSMFAEDVELLPRGSFYGLLVKHHRDPATLQQMLRYLWTDMDRGGFSVALADAVLRFNGKLFKGANADGYSLRLTPEQIDWVIEASRANWREVEPAIFGTLLERALDPAERHALGAHYTPRPYVERLVIPTVIEPLRSEWADAQAAALTLAHEAAQLEASPPEVRSKKDFVAMDRHNATVRGRWREARDQVREFLHRLCTVRVLDPACGSGNFLYVTLEHLKRLEGEVLNQLGALGDTQDALDLGRETVTLQQLLGIELNERAAALAELVLWIGYLQWHIRTSGRASVAEPVVHDYGNIAHRDAVLAYDRQEPVIDERGRVVSRWDGRTTKPHPATGEPVPNESAQVVQWRYVHPRKAEWPPANFIVGNPPFIGNKRMRTALGDGYAAALRGAWPEVPESADFVMYWWHHAAETVRLGRAERFGLITTNSLTMIFNRRVIEAHQNADPPLSLVFAVPDHPWVDSKDGAAVRIAMTVGVRGAGAGRLCTVTREQEGADGEIAVSLGTQTGPIHADLTVGINIAAASVLESNRRMAFRGVTLLGEGFWLARTDPLAIMEPRALKPIRNGRDITDRSRDLLCIDLFGLDEHQARSRFPGAFQRLLDRVKPEREVCQRASYRQRWWTFAESRPDFRLAVAGLRRFIATPMTAKHRLFTMLPAEVLPDQGIVAIASDDAFTLGVLSSSVHMEWALAAGGTLEDRPRYNQTRCFETYPFPADDTGLTPDLVGRVRTLAEALDSHRKTRQQLHPEVSLTSLYNVLTKLRSGMALSAAEATVHERGLVSLLRSLHDELDTAVLETYGWSDLSLPTDTDTLLARLSALNAKRAADESIGTVRWLRPEFQQRSGVQTGIGSEHEATDTEQTTATLTTTVPVRPWPSGLTEQIKAVADVTARVGRGLDLHELAAHFTGRGRWRERLPTILDTLATLGRVRVLPNGRWVDAGLNRSRSSIN